MALACSNVALNGPPLRIPYSSPCGAQPTGSPHIHVIAEEASPVAELCIGQDMGTVSTATAFM